MPDLNWYVLICDPGREHIAVDRLERQGFMAYVPRLWRRQPMRGRIVEA